MAGSGGRPRDPQADAAILDAVRALLTDGGWEAVTFQRVAAHAGVGQPTVYRRWPTKLALVEAAVFPVSEWTPPRPTGDLEADLGRLGADLVESLLTPVVRAALPQILAAHSADLDGAGERELRAWATDPVRDAYAAIVTAALPGVADRPDLIDPTFDAFHASLTYPALVRSPAEARAGVAATIAVAVRTARATWSPSLVTETP
ncbi:TetR/AcrR family transcriptional regulator [Nocardioides fonticola]|uniref:TetR/AcrR family transcriptional regulator n=1 Tax=Nocardioides fonticola TaxID=450363 RepID=A0ABP7XMV0_9ACTN